MRDGARDRGDAAGAAGRHPEAVGFLRFVDHAPESVLSFNFGTGGKTLGTHRRRADGIAGTADDVVYRDGGAGARDLGRGFDDDGSDRKVRAGTSLRGRHVDKVADWASHLGSNVDVSVSHSIQVYESTATARVPKQNLRWQTYPALLSGPRRRALLRDGQPAPRTDQRDGYISMTSGGSGSNPAGYADLWVYARVERLTGTGYRFTLRAASSCRRTRCRPSATCWWMIGSRCR